MSFLYLDTEAVPPGDQPADPTDFEAWQALALRPGSARIVCMSYALSTGEVSTVDSMESIADVLWEYRNIPWVAHAGQRYDFPIIYANLARAGSRRGAITVLHKRLNAKPWESPLIDTAPCGRSYRKLSEYCEMHGVVGKTDDIGSRVWEVWKTDPARVRSYCEGDVQALRAAHQEELKISGERT